MTNGTVGALSSTRITPLPGPEMRPSPACCLSCDVSAPSTFGGLHAVPNAVKQRDVAGVSIATIPPAFARREDFVDRRALDRMLFSGRLDVATWRVDIR